jgi:UDP-N-acetylmuramate--alanine ligase
MDLTPREDAPPPALILNADSLGCLDVLRELGDWPGVVRTFGIQAEKVDVRAREISVAGETSFALEVDGAALGRVTLRTPGRHYVANALAATAAATLLGVRIDALAPALESFTGLLRRFQIVEDGDVTFVDDYAHHPHAIAVTLETARARFAGRRLIAVFQPTLYTRLHRFLGEFAAAFDDADDALIVETQPSREADTGLVHGSDLVERMRERAAFAGRPEAVQYGGTFAETASALRGMRRPGDVVVVMGSGPVDAVIGLARLS